MVNKKKLFWIAGIIWFIAGLVPILLRDYSPVEWYLGDTIQRLLESLYNLVQLIVGLILLLTIAVLLLRKNYKKATTLAAIIIGFSLAQITKSTADEIIISYNTSQGKKIVAALNEYCQERKEYPDTLQELVPEYIDTIPTTFYLKKPDYSLSYWLRKYPDNVSSSDGPSNEYPYNKSSKLSLGKDFYWFGDSYSRYEAFADELEKENMPCGDFTPDNNVPIGW